MKIVKVNRVLGLKPTVALEDDFAGNRIYSKPDLSKCFEVEVVNAEEAHESRSRLRGDSFSTTSTKRSLLSKLNNKLRARDAARGVAYTASNSTMSTWADDDSICTTGSISSSGSYDVVIPEEEAVEVARQEKTPTNEFIECILKEVNGTQRIASIITSKMTESGLRLMQSFSHMAAQNSEGEDDGGDDDDDSAGSTSGVESDSSSAASSSDEEDSLWAKALDLLTEEKKPVVHGSVAHLVYGKSLGK